MKKDVIKISLRSYSEIDISNFAHKYGGGGHMHAAGFQLTGPIKSIEKQVLAELKLLLKV